jgi:hypothetical protein
MTQDTVGDNNEFFSGRQTSVSSTGVCLRDVWVVRLMVCSFPPTLHSPFQSNAPGYGATPRPSLVQSTSPARKQLHVSDTRPQNNFSNHFTARTPPSLSNATNIRSSDHFLHERRSVCADSFGAGGTERAHADTQPSPVPSVPLSSRGETRMPSPESVVFSWRSTVRYSHRRARVGVD